MTENNKKSFAYKLQKNPFLLVFIIIIFAVAVFGIVNITSAIQKNSKEKNTTTTELVTETQNKIETTEAEATEALQLLQINRYITDIKNVTPQIEENCVSLKVEFSDNASLLKAHTATDANSLPVVPVFCFYLKDGVQIKCPGEIKVLGDGKTAVYYLSVIDDYANVAALTDDITVSYANALENKFNVYLQHKTDGTGKTVLGTYSKTVEEIEASSSKAEAVNNVAQGIKTVDITKTDEFVWVDIYYNDINSYTQLNNDFITNFVCFGFDKNGVSYKRDFITTEYDSLNMVRCKFDSYSLKGLADEIGAGEITVSDLFTQYVISVWTTDYDKDTSLFTING